MDKRLGVILAVAVILSTLIVLTIFRAREPDDLTVLRNKFPELFIKESAQKGIDISFSFAAISGRASRELELRFSILYEGPPRYDDDAWMPEGMALTEIVSHIPMIADLESRVDAMGGEVEVLEEEVEVNGTLYEGVFYDFSRFLGLFNGDWELSRWISMFAVLKKGDQVRFFQGRTGFLLEQEEVVEYLTISHGENKTDYVGANKGDAPNGILRYSDYGKDEKVSVLFGVQADTDSIMEIPMGASDRLILQIIKGYTDASLSAFIVNGFPGG
jgi:hypothetical protein